MLAALGAFAASAGAQTPTTGGSFWPALGVHTQLRPDVRVKLLGQSKSGTDYTYQQWSIGGGLGYQWKRFVKPHLVDLDPDREHLLLMGTGYEYLRTTEGSKPGFENRIATEVTLQARPPGGFEVSDRNRFEFRWVNGTYSTRYRNRLILLRAASIGAVHLTPYLSAEAFYDWAHASWNEFRYTAGVEWPIGPEFKLTTYYLRQECDTCDPHDVNVIGLMLGYFYRT